MKARLKNNGGVTIVELMGYLDFETTGPFRTQLLDLLQNQNVVFNFTELNFVGSSGITPFVDLLTEYLQVFNTPFKFCGVGSEFKKVFRSGRLDQVEIFEDEWSAVASFFQPVQHYVISDAQQIVNQVQPQVNHVNQYYSEESQGNNGPPPENSPHNASSPSQPQQEIGIEKEWQENEYENLPPINPEIKD